MPESEIIFTRDLAHELESFLKERSYSAICILVDENTRLHCLPQLRFNRNVPYVIEISSGEAKKNLATCEYIWTEMTGWQLDRKALMINLGGGVIGDMGGFCAATYKRGIDFIQVPTTLLSQVDASVGGKLGIDFLDFKNHIGLFRQPNAVFIHVPFLQTLSKAELRSGFAEIIKHCLIADGEKFKEIQSKSFNDQNWDDLARHSISIKNRITSEDPLESGIRKILNFGHTVGHAIESYFLNIPGKRLLHGEAIAAGIVCESYLSFKKKFLTEDSVAEISEFVFSIYGSIQISEADIEIITPLVLQDKKNDHNIIQCSLLEKIGRANYNIPVTLEEVKDSILFYNSRHAGTKIQLS